jgi:asparagine synthase (glutamine-hydrolysing)
METEPVRQARQQPAVLDDRYWLLGDVRLDGRAQLHERLIKSGVHLAPEATDEELLLHAWRCFGEATLQFLFGDFAFAVWDNHEKKLCCARHFTGARPFFYAQFPGGFCFGNTLQTFRAVPEISRQLDEHFIGDCLLAGWCADSTRTVYSHIHRLPAAHILTVQNNHIEVRRFLTLPIEEPLQLADSDLIEAFREHLHRAIQDQMPTSGPVALQLSGGLDSGAICAVASQSALEAGNSSALKAFTMSWRPFMDDEEPHYASLTATKLGLPHQIFERTDVLPWDEQIDQSTIAPEPTFDTFSSYTREFAQITASHSRVVLSGDGGDEILTGQAWPYLVYLWNRRAFSTIASTFGAFLLAHGRMPPLRGGFRTRALGLFKKSDPWKHYPSWLNPSFEERVDLRQRWQQRARPPVSAHPLHPQAHAGLQSDYLAQVFESDDPGISGVLLQKRTPFMDLRLLRFLLRVPPVPWCANKILLRDAVKLQLPPAVLRRAKTPLVTEPVEVCLRRGLWEPMSSLRVSAPRISEFIDLHKWSATLRIDLGSQIMENLFPLPLLRWLKAIENT